MSSFNGLKKIAATDIQNSGRFYLGNQVDTGTAGQALVSGGPNEPARWDIHTGTIQPLTIGTNLSLASGNPTFDGGTPDTINATDTNTQLNLTGGDGVTITNTGGLNRTIETDNDEITISNSGGQNEVLKVPNDLTISQNGTIIDTFNGSTAKTIDLEGKYSAGDGIDISGHPVPHIEADTDEVTISHNVGGAEKLQVLKVPNDLTFTGYATGTFNGSSPLSINLVDTDTTYSAGTNLNLVGTTFNVNASLTGIDSITMNSTPGSTAITGNNYPSNPTTCSYLDLSSSTNVFPNFVGGSEILKSMSFIDNTVQNYNIISNTSNEFFFSGSQSFGSDTLEIDFTATSTTGYCEYGFYANSSTSGMIFNVGIAAATGGTSPLSTTLTSSPVAIDAYKIGLFDGTTTAYSLKEILDFTGFENTYVTSKFFFNNLTVGTRYRMSLYGRNYNSGNILVNSGGKNTTGYATRSAHQPTFMKFYEYDSSIGGARTTGSGSGK